VTLGRGWGLYGSADSSWGPLASWVRPRDPPVVLNSIMVPQLLSGRGLNAMLLTARFPEGIAPASPIHAEPVIPFDACLSFELYFPQGRAAVGLCGAFDLLENVQLGHRNCLLWFNSYSNTDPGPQEIVPGDGVGHPPVFLDWKIQQMFVPHDFDRLRNGRRLVHRNGLLVHDLLYL